MNDRVGQQFGNYRLLRLLGQGDSSETYLGEHVSLKTFAAIKIWRLQLASQAQENFYSQARVLERLSQPNILPVLEHGMERETPFLIMQYAPNGSLRQRYRRGSILPPEVILPYVKQIAAGLRYAHKQNIIHRNIKPENLLLGPNNEILLSDFGIFSGSPIQQASNVTYTAPEQTQGRAVPASDQYSLAVVIYEWLTGSVPFNGSSF